MRQPAHGGSCTHLGELGINGELLDGDPSDAVSFDEARRLALDACAVNSPPCNQQAAQDTWDDANTNLQGGVSRITQAQTMCASYGCSADTDEEVVDWMCDRGYTNRCNDDFEPDAP